MRSLSRATLSIALAVTPWFGIGCAHPSFSSSGMMQTCAPCRGTLNGARMAEQQGDFKQAKRLYQAVHKEDPTNVESLHRLGVVCTRLSQHKEAKSYYRQAFKLAPDNAELLGDMGYSAFIRNEMELSESFLEQSVRLNGSNPNTMKNLAIARAWRGKDESSLQAFRLVYGDDDARRLLTEIQVARGDVRPVRMDIAQTDVLIPPSPTAAEPTGVAYVDNTDALTVVMPTVTTAKTLTLVERASSEQVATAMQIDLALGETPTSQTEATIALPPLLPPITIQELHQSNESATLTVQSTAIEGSVGISVEIPRIEIPDRDQTGSFTSETASNRTETSADFTIALPHVEANERLTIESQKPFRGSPGSAWRKARRAPEAWPDLFSLDNSEPRIVQTSGYAIRQEDKKASCGVCLVTLFEEQVLIPGDAKFEVLHGSQAYRFSSKESLEKFRANPDRYLPAVGGLDVVSVRNERAAVKGSFNFALRFQNQLYLFTSRANATEFRRNPQNFVAVDRANERSADDENSLSAR